MTILQTKPSIHKGELRAITIALKCQLKSTLQIEILHTQHLTRDRQTNVVENANRSTVKTSYIPEDDHTNLS